MKSTIEKKYQPKDHLVAFIDVLGFSKMVLDDGGTGIKLEFIKQAIEEAFLPLEKRKKEPNHPYAFWYKEFQIRSFSDCFCFSVPLKFHDGVKDYEQNLLAFYVWIQAFCNVLLKNGLLCRGGVTQGWHYADDKIIFSQALIDAYLLESKQADHPLMLVHPVLVNSLLEKGIGDKPYSKLMFAHDIDGKTFLNQFNYSIVDEMFFGFSEKVKPKFLRERTNLINMFLDVIEDQLANLTENRAIAKWQWMKDLSHNILRNKHQDKFQPGLFRDVDSTPNLAGR